jgi:hypothetical protein
VQAEQAIDVRDVPRVCEERFPVSDSVSADPASAGAVFGHFLNHFKHCLSPFFIFF